MWDEALVWLAILLCLLVIGGFLWADSIKRKNRGVDREKAVAEARQALETAYVHPQSSAVEGEHIERQVAAKTVNERRERTVMRDEPRGKGTYNSHTPDG